MADLKSLFAKKADNGQADSAGSATPKPNPFAPKAVVSESAGTGRVQGSAPTAQTETGGTPDSKPKKPVFGVGKSAVNSGGNETSSGTDSSSEQPKSGLAALRSGSGSSDSSNDSGGVVTSSINSLDSLARSEVSGTASPRDSLSQFSDETPATKPTRELPEGLTTEQLGFVQLIDGVYEILHDPDLLGGVIRNIMIELKSNPEYTKLMAPEDFRAMVRGMRESMGLARVKKQESKAKKSGGRKSKALDDDVLMGLDDVLGGIEI